MKFKRLIGCVVFVALMTCGIYRISERVEHKDSKIKNGYFLETADEYEVLFFGSSIMIDSVYPYEIYKEQGIKSYMLGGYQQLPSANYWHMINALDYANPKVIVFDASGVRYDQKMSASSTLFHRTFDYLPLSINKIKTVLDLCDDKNGVDNYGFEYGKYRLEFLVDILKYHGRWKEITENDFYPSGNYELGSARNFEVVPNSYQRTDVDEKLQANSIQQEYLKKAIEECQKRDIQILVTEIAAVAEKESYMEANTVADICNDYGVPYINFYKEKDLVDFTTDIRDSGQHLNASGGQKITKCIGDYLKANFNLTDYSDDEKWNQMYADYYASKVVDITSQEQPLNALMLLHDESFSSVVYLKKDSYAYNDPAVLQMITNIRAEGVSEEFQNAIDESGEYITFSDEVAKENFESSMVDPNGADIQVVLMDKKGGVLATLKWSAGDNAALLKNE